MNTQRRSMAALLAAALAATLCGCATIAGSNEQEVLVRTIVDFREVAGVGCLLTNNVGRWFVTAPARVTIRKSAGALMVECSKEGVGAASERIASHVGTASLIGNAVVSGGLGYLVDRHSGAGFDYPLTLTVLMHRPLDTRAAAAEAGSANVLY